MKRKINVLIFASILGLIALSIIQGYLINNTYKLEKDAFIEETKRAVFRFDDQLTEIDSIYEIVGEEMVDRIIDYKLGRLEKHKFLNEFNNITDTVNPKFIKLYQDAFRSFNLSHPVKFQKRLRAVVLLDSVFNDTLFYKPQKINSLYLLGEAFDVESAYALNNSQITNDVRRNYVENGIEKSVSIEFQVTTQDYINIDGWEKEVLRRMSGILVLSIFIFTFVLGLLYYSIKSLITQKKIADIKTDFVNNITHELKTPLATLTLATKMLRKEEIQHEPKLVDNTVQTIERQNKRLQKLIDQVLNNSLGYKEIELNKESVIITDYINTVLDDFELSVKSKDLKLNRNFNLLHSSIRIDKFYMTTALLNILENAVKYSENNIEINIDVQASNHLKISIEDNGIGISDKDKNQIFEKFYRAGNTEVHNVKGLGLGLYYTKQIIKAHNGDIIVKSQKNNGTIFILTIPIN